MSISLPDAVLAIGSLGTASFALVDASKAVLGGISRWGFGHVDRVLARLYPPAVDAKDEDNPLGLRSVRATLFANWLNGMALADQRSIAKTLVKLRLDPENAPSLAARTGVDRAKLVSIAAKYATGEALDHAEQDAAGRFDLLLTTLLEEGYQRADQAYRNGSKIAAAAVAVVLALLGNWALGADKIGWLEAFIAGLLAAPLAPVSKDLASALQASVRAMQILRR
ncbi:MAG: hypothetical protein LGL72_14430 [Acidibrevibacterium sp.]|nr:hypothetical protein [Acidibrevibacterium fodinaquatile]MCA7120557.1 hypothetical protein [Acidibrevibacterium fodinaquatile]